MKTPVLRRGGLDTEDHHDDRCLVHQRKYGSSAEELRLTPEDVVFIHPAMFL